MRGRIEQRWDDFRGGVRSRASGGVSGDGVIGEGKSNELLDAFNVTYDRESGLIRRRNGHIAALFYAGADYQSMFPAKGLPAGASSQLLLARGTSIDSYTVAGGVSGTQVATGLTANTLMEGAMAPQSGGQGPAYLLNGWEARYWTGAAGGAWTASTGTLPVGYYPLFHGNRMWVARCNSYAGVGDPGSLLAWSAVGNPRDWPAENVNLFDPSDGGTITGIGRIGSYLLVFKQSKMWLVYDLDSGANRLLSGEIGSVSHRSIVETQRGTYFLTRDRGWAVTDGSTIKLLEDKPNIIEGLDTTTTGSSYFSHGEFINDRLYSAMVQPGSFTDLFEYDAENDAWWPMSRPPTHMCVWDGAGKPELWGIDVTVKALVRLFAREGSDQVDYSGSGVSAYIETQPADFETDRLKRLRALTIEGDLRALVTPVSGDQTVGGRVIDTDVTTGRRAVVHRKPGLRPGRLLKARIVSNDSAVAPRRFEVAAVTIHADLAAR